MSPVERLSGEERREAIIKAVRKLFADKGFHAVTTRELAEAAGVSEALLYKHFPSKEVMYEAMQSECQEEVQSENFKLKALESSTSSLVVIVHFLLSKIILGCPGPSEDDRTFSRLMLRSTMEDGVFARMFAKRVVGRIIDKLEDSLKAAAAAGDLVDAPKDARSRAWFVHHIGVMIMLDHMPDQPTVDYGVPKEKLVEQAVMFALRGLGLKEEAIRRHYNPKALALLIG
jgi:AcrR family transcriptional regulator